MSAITVKEELAYYTGKAGELVRLLGLGALAAIWLFHSSTPTVPNSLPAELKCATILVIGALAVDALQYVIGSILWGVKTLNAPDEKAADQHGAIITMFVFIAVKSFLLAAAYSLLLLKLATKIAWV
jgi:hypothetical protein